MQLTALHLYSPVIADQVVRIARGEEASPWQWWMGPQPALDGSPITEDAAKQLTSNLTLAMTAEYPIFHNEGCTLTQWEARIDRGVGMLMRPPARIFVDHDVNPRSIAQMPIRLDLQGGPPMGGAWVPPHLIGHLQKMIEERLDLWARRIHDAEMDPYPMLTTMHMAVSIAATEGLGLIESVDVLPPDARIIRTPDRKHMDPDLRQRIDLALKQDEQTLLDRILRRK